MRTWTLPEHIEDLLPADARKLERLRRTVLDRFERCGYELVMPPLLEYIESLLSGTGHDMDLATFKLVDQLSGRTMGIRADTTPQVARMDAHILNRQGVARLCYAGSVLHTLPAGLGKSRQPFQAGAEIYGHAGLDADIEIQQLMIDVLRELGIKGLQMDIGHPAIFRSLIESARLSAEDTEQVFIATVAKDMPALQALAPALGASAEALLALPGLYGDASVFAEAARVLPAVPAIADSLAQLTRIQAHFSTQGVKVSIDLGELGGFNYESGITFSAYATGAPDAVARGGRYDEVGRAFGRARPATGFSMDLKSLLSLTPEPPTHGRILGPATTDHNALDEIERLRSAGEIVVARLPGHDAHADELGCDRELKHINGRWAVLPRT